MSDLDRYIEERAARDPEFAEGLESGYAEFKADVLRRQAGERDGRAGLPPAPAARAPDSGPRHW